MTAAGVTPAMRLGLTGLPLSVAVLLLAPHLAPERPAAGLAVALTLQLAVTGLAVAGLSRGYPYDRLGPANLVTQGRAALTASLSAALVVMPDAAVLWAVTSIAVLCLFLDGVDGQLARRSGLVSRFGARFDMETDSLLALLLALVAFRSGSGGVLVLALGLPRYGFWVLGRIYPRLSGPLPERMGRKLVCVIQIVALLLIVSPLTGPASSDMLALFALACLAWSFGRDILFLCR
ncbi:CDP-alcohol phosphatidyltransferase family protein [Aureimonas frigidaquae]|uniref:CDP-alcohol phosphatidyltransferase n=1 Tax=Aureimonas frigidaquae TaxID=424757 RepID=A0A0P0Z4G7_9HYPH|nr:CDP-alcohol phosphatidyltransferase family protein [Aureimonas frigidaquae]BAT28752.1 CDP-alcohol phosphatidyltransferase precursor [Aureimonas frigidaquae]